MFRKAQGQSLVEMALVLPFLLMFTLGVIETGYYIYTYSELENATRRASERASKTPPSSATNPNDPNDKCAQFAEVDAMQGIYLRRLEPRHISFFFPPIVESDGSSRPGERRVGDQIEVAINYQGSFLTPFGENMFGEFLDFQFRSRRTITSINAPRGFNYDCSPQ